MSYIDRKKKVFFFFAVVLLLVSSIFMAIPETTHAASQTVNKQSKVSDGILYQNINYKDGSTQNRVNVLKVNLNDKFTEVQLGKADPMNKLETVRTKAAKYNKPGNRVLGAINGSFYNVDERIPVNLISENNRLVFAGVVHESNKNTYVNEPIAFGVDANGKGIVDYYDLTFNYTYNGKTYPITNTNKSRKTNNTILYTSDFYQSTTGTNQYGTEVVFETSYQPKMTFGSNYKLTVSAIRKVGDTKPVTIPKNGFVLSGHGTGSDRLAQMKVGDKVEINVDIDSKWKNSSFMIAGGPQLVKDGKVNMTINPNSAVAKAIAPRSAVAVDKSGKNVFLVTVDGRQGNASPGMSLSQFASYLVNLGADTALNLDGGGSTTMVAQLPGSSKLQVVNTPSDNFERGVSTILMAVDKADYVFNDVSNRISHYDGIKWLKSKGIKGYPDGNYRVDEKLKRSHAAIMFTNSLGLGLQSKNVAPTLFKDVKATHDYADYIATVGQAKIFKGNQGRFLPESTMTREQMATTIVNAFNLKESTTHKKVNLSNVDPSHKKNVQILADLGITTQLDNFRPGEAVTRGQFASFLYRASLVK